jgi:hypothetical protein
MHEEVSHSAILGNTAIGPNLSIHSILYLIKNEFASFDPNPAVGLDRTTAGRNSRLFEVQDIEVSSSADFFTAVLETFSPKTL